MTIGPRALVNYLIRTWPLQLTIHQDGNLQACSYYSCLTPKFIAFFGLDMYIYTSDYQAVIKSQSFTPPLASDSTLLMPYTPLYPRNNLESFRDNL